MPSPSSERLPCHRPSCPPRDCRASQLFELARFLVVGAGTYGLYRMYLRRDVPTHFPAQNTVVAGVIAVGLFAVSGVISRTRRESLEVCAAPSATRSVPCKKGCDWIDRYGFGTAKACDCRNCLECSWDRINKRCVKRSVDVELANADADLDETTRLARAAARERAALDRSLGLM